MTPALFRVIHRQAKPLQAARIARYTYRAGSLPAAGRPLPCAPQGTGRTRPLATEHSNVPPDDVPLPEAEQPPAIPQVLLLALRLSGPSPPTPAEHTAALWDELITRVQLAFAQIREVSQAIVTNADWPIRKGHPYADEATATMLAIARAERDALAFARSGDVAERLRQISEYLSQKDVEQHAAELARLLDEMIARADAALQAYQPLLLAALRDRWPSVSVIAEAQSTAEDHTAPAALPTDAGMKKRRMTRAQAHGVAERLDAENPQFKNLTAAKMAEQIGCSVGLVHKTPYWKRTMAANQTRSRGKRRGKEVSFTEAVASRATRDELSPLDRLVKREEDEQAREEIRHSAAPREEKQQLLEKLDAGEITAAAAKQLAARFNGVRDTDLVNGMRRSA